MWREVNCGILIACPIARQFQSPCVFRSTGWDVRKIKFKELASVRDLPQVNAS